MKLEIQMGGRARMVEVLREGTRLRCSIDGREVHADAAEISPGVYSILFGGGSEALEVHVAPGADAEQVEIYSGGRQMHARVQDPRAWRGKHGHSIEAEGRQQITAPMPGKIVRVLVAEGDTVETGRGLLVVEAMKMQNEIRAPKTGKVEGLRVSEGQAVNAGEILLVIT
jgi:biotin carboxyl carrier protein